MTSENRKTISRIIILCAIAIGCASDRARAAGASDIYDLADIVAVQDRAYKMNESLGLGASYLPSDAFNRGTSLQAFYTYSFSDLFTWEILNYGYVINQETQTKKDITSQGFSVNAGDGGKLDFPVHIFSTGVVITPVYFKGLMFNKRLLYGELSLYLGAGNAILNQTGSRILLTPGVQARFYMSQRWAMRFHLRDSFYNDTKQGLNSMIDFGIAFELSTRFFGSRTEAK